MTQHITHGNRGIDSELRRGVNIVVSSKKGNAELYLKAAIFLTLYVALYATPFFFSVPTWLMIAGAVLGGFDMAGIGMNIMHDAAHGSFSSKGWVNKLFASSMYLVGGDIPNWEIQHNMIHHTHTNVHGRDDDLESNGLFRFSPHQPWKKHHRFQQYYAYFFYSLMTLLWATTKDFAQASRYHKEWKEGKEGKEGREGFENIRQKLFLITLAKLGYYVMWLGIPLLFWDVSDGVVVVSFLVMHLTAGLVLGIVFQPAHVSSLTLFVDKPALEDKPVVLQSRAEHQIRTSCNYAMNNKFITWYTGGLNYQIEHHLFPYISHVHYPKLAPIVKQCCIEYGLPYNNLGSFRDAQVDHFKQLEMLGKKPE